MAEQEEGNIKQHIGTANVGLNMDNSPSQMRQGQWSYSLNANVENFDANTLSIQNEAGNEPCIQIPEGFVSIGNHFINEQTKYIFFITNPSSGDSQIGYMENNDCIFHVLVDAVCLNFNINYPIHKCVHKITNCSTEIYWTDGYNPRRYLDIDNIPYTLEYGSQLCNPGYSANVDCNQLKIQPDFSIPQIEVIDVTNTGNIISGTYQFAVQYSDAAANAYTAYYSVTNPTPIADISLVSPNFNTPVGKSIVIDITNLDITGQFQWFNIAVIKTINAITSVELIGTYFIDRADKQITYTGQAVDNIRLSINDIFEKFPYYDIAQDLTVARDILIWDQLSSIDRINYQQIWNKVKLEWETWRIPDTENYADELNATNLRSYLRDEVYAIEGQFLLRNGKETDSFHIPAREISVGESLMPDVDNTNPDFIGDGTSAPYWKIYNTASVTGYSPGYSPSPTYKGPYQYGEFAYWESLEEYPCNTDVWGDLAGQKIRHHKFPDVLVSPIMETKLFTTVDNMVMGNDAVFPIGIRINTSHIQSLINSSNLTQEQKDEIIGFKILRGDRNSNKSIIAKGILRNVNKYEKEGNEYYFPNYPYNDLREDPFLNQTNNAFSQECEAFEINITALKYDSITNSTYAEIEYTDCNTNKVGKKRYTSIPSELDIICSIVKPTITFGEGTVAYQNYDTYVISSEGLCPKWTATYNDRTYGIIETECRGYLAPDRIHTIQVVLGTEVKCIDNCEPGFPYEGCKANTSFRGSHIIPSTCTTPESISAPTDAYRQVFNSPETSFGQPFLGNILKLESVIYGKGKAHFKEVKDNAKYRLVTKEAQEDALDSSAALGGMTKDFDTQAMFAAYQAYLTIYINGITRKNYAYSFNSIADYNYSNAVPNDIGVKQRTLDVAKYLIPAVVSMDGDDVNNWERESSVYLKTIGSDGTIDPLPFPDKSPQMLNGLNPIIEDKSRFTISEAGNCGAPEAQEDINVVSYYASLKNIFENQWGQIYSYTTIDTGFQRIFTTSSGYETVFGGDTFISRFAFKTKLPFFIDNRVKAPDDSDIFYDEIGNVAYPKYWHSSRSILADYNVPPGTSNSSPGILTNIISYKAHNFDCPDNTGVITTGTTTTYYGTTTTTTTSLIKGTVTEGNSERTYYDGYFYLFAYGVPSFYCESSYNTDLRQAFNNREGDFWPHVTNSIPDDWVQESFVSIANDNTYNYNTTYSKQNKENFFSHLPPDWKSKICFTQYPFRAIYSDPQTADSDNRINAWRNYKALSYFDFPQNYGQLCSLDGIENRAILARFENKTLMYDKLLTIDTSNPQAAYMGNSRLFSESPPIDFADTDLGYVGSQNKMLLKIPNGQISVDAKRGQVFLISGTQATDLSGFGSGMNRFFTDHTAFEILRYFPEADTDNHFNGIGLHGVYDSKYDRIILTKLDYVPIRDDIMYDPITKEFYIEEKIPITITTCDLSGEAVLITTTTTSSTTSTTSTTTTAILTTHWVGSGVYCVPFYIDETPIGNTGYAAFATLIEVYDNTGLPTGNIKDNTIGDSDYISPVLDVEACPPYTTTTTTIVI